MNTSFARILVVVSLSSTLALNANAISASPMDAVGSLWSWARGYVAAPVQQVGTIGSLWLAAKALSPFGSYAAVGSGVALGWKARTILSDKKTIARYATIFGSGLAAGIILAKYPWVATNFIKATAPAIVPLALGCYLTNRATSWIS